MICGTTAGVRSCSCSLSGSRLFPGMTGEYLNLGHANLTLTQSSNVGLNRTTLVLSVTPTSVLSPQAERPITTLKICLTMAGELFFHTGSALTRTVASSRWPTRPSSTGTVSAQRMHAAMEEPQETPLATANSNIEQPKWCKTTFSSLLC